MFALRKAVAVLIVVSALLGSSKVEGKFHYSELLQTLTNLKASPSLEQRCATYEQTIRSSLPAHQQAAMSKDGLYRHLMSEIESREALNEDEERVVNDIEHCFDFNSLPGSTSSALAPTPADIHESKLPSPTDNGNQQQQSEPVAQLEQSQEQPIEQPSSDLALLKQLERDLAREKIRASKIDRLQRKVVRKAGEKALNKLRVKFDEFRQDISGIMKNFISAYGDPVGKRRENVQLINERVGQFKIVMKKQIKQVLHSIDLLKADQGQDDQQYVHIKEGFRKLESELEGFIQSQVTQESFVYRDQSSRTELARLTDVHLGEFHKMLEKQLYEAREYIGYIGQPQEQLLELLKQLERDLAREKSRASKIDGLQRKITRKAGEKALDKLRVKFDEFRQDISGTMKNFISAYGDPVGKRRENVQLINERVGQFKIVMKSQIEKVLDNIDLLKAKQGQDDQQYVHIKEGFRKLESELEGFIQSQVTQESFVYRDQSSRTELARLTDVHLGEFHKMLEKQLYEAREYIGYIGQPQEQLLELLKQLERDLAREKSRASKIDELQRKVIRKAGEKALNKFRVKSDEFRRDISGIMKNFINAYGESVGERRKNVQLINGRVGQFKIVMKSQIEKVMDNIDLLKAKQEQDDQQYVHIKEGFRKLESELERFIQSQVTDESYVYPDPFSRTKFARSIDARLGEFHKMLERQLYAAREYIGHLELHGRQEME